MHRLPPFSYILRDDFHGVKPVSFQQYVNQENVHRSKFAQRYTILHANTEYQRVMPSSPSSSPSFFPNNRDKEKDSRRVAQMHHPLPVLLKDDRPHHSIKHAHPRGMYIHVVGEEISHLCT